jgi:hypothetical protein
MSNGISKKISAQKIAHKIAGAAKDEIRETVKSVRGQVTGKEQKEQGKGSWLKKKKDEESEVKAVASSIYNQIIGAKSDYSDLPVDAFGQTETPQRRILYLEDELKKLKKQREQESYQEMVAETEEQKAIAERQQKDSPIIPSSGKKGLGPRLGKPGGNQNKMELGKGGKN